MTETQAAMKTAKYIKTVEARGMAALYKLSEPVKFDHDELETEFVIVSSPNNEWCQETFIFPSNGDGDWLDMMELAGSFQGTVGSLHKDRFQALKGLGFYARD